jgi:galactokinase
MSTPDQCVSARERLETVFGGGGSIACASAPGRANLVGGHTDYNDGFVLPVAIDRRTAVAARPRDDETVRVHAADFEETVTFESSSLDPPESVQWVDYVRGVVAELRASGVEVTGADIAIVGGVPHGAGLSSSAALEVAVAAALAEAYGVEFGRQTLAEVAWRAETGFVGLDCGIMDQYAVALCKSEHALFLDCRSRETEHVPFGADRARVVVVDTNAEHALVDSAYNERVSECRRGVEILDEHVSHDVDALRDVSPDTFDAHADALPETVRRRCRHVVHENARVQQAVSALRNDDFERVGGLLFESHGSLRDDYEVSCTELDAVVDIARSVEGVYGARLTGAGFGGSVVALVAPEAVEEFTEAVRREYPDRTGIDPDVYACDVVGGYELSR